LRVECHTSGQGDIAFPLERVLMSLIYEALQRAESESEGRTAATSASATELLKRAEQQAHVQRNAESGAAPSRPFTVPTGETANILHSLFSPTDATGAPVADLSAPAGFGPDDFKILHLAQPFHSRLVVLADRNSPASEAFRLLGVRLRHMRRERSLKKLLVCSTVTQEGKSVVSANLGCTMAADSQQNVLLIEGDIRRPSLSQLFGIEEHPGLCEYLAGKRKLAESIYRLDEAHLWLMPAGNSADSKNDLVQSDSVQRMLQQLGDHFHWLIIDSPPVLPLADTSVWQRAADGTLLVARNSTTQKRKLLRGLEALDPEKLVGAVLNSATTSSEHDYYYYRSDSDSPDKVETV
jgi:capsular exopolysaccharide synthesis family protein